ncbi:CYTH and CHAD domain-containing protein [Usitatibacter palustris]|uniref:Inorganic triphosphatase YgiF, contains CYTH and CHAD domains n=1 Tax=Usitatibacter palustris TaxID=2732487 RepID=A0A6M4HD50_9PROT|nr:CYTH and CHAD domain-containing protein [Usitatibacter palustris]QJR16648.1 hypothetical protein DSM104440_03483 [Usitatibacter palustris]
MSADPTETELKFAIAPEDAKAFERAPALKKSKPRRQRLLNLYFDTPDHALADAGMALRLRKAGGRWTQALKGGTSGTGGLHSRGEWEFPRKEPTLDLTLFVATPLFAMKQPERLQDQLANAFTVDFQRETWIVEPQPGERLEVALDRGEVRSGDRTEAVCEVEIEVLEGPRDAAFDLAHSLMKVVRLRPSAVTKAQRGNRLVRNAELAPRKASAVELEASMSIARAARAIVGTALDQLQANEEDLLVSNDPEFVHQARVALRRMRSALRLFRDELGDPRTEQWREALGDIARAFGGARDWDVFATEVLPSLRKSFGDAKLSRSLASRATARRMRERDTAREALRSAAYATLVLDLARWLSDEPPPRIAGESLTDFASALIRKRHKRLLADAKQLAKRSPEERHQIRIDAKRLRYCVDGFASLFKDSRVEKYSRALGRLQDVLGRANDATTAMQLVSELEAPAAFASFARGYLAARAEDDVASLADHVAALDGTKRFWARKPAAPSLEG